MKFNEKGTNLSGYVSEGPEFSHIDFLGDNIETSVLFSCDIEGGKSLELVVIWICTVNYKGNQIFRFDIRIPFEITKEHIAPLKEDIDYVVAKSHHIFLEEFTSTTNRVLMNIKPSKFDYQTNETYSNQLKKVLEPLHELKP